MIVIAVISIIVLWATRIDFNRWSNEQKLAIFTNEVVSKIETVRNNALVWKGIWIDVETPDSWNIRVSDTGSWSLQTSYDIWATSSISQQYSTTPNTFYSIWNMRCIQLDDTTETLSPNADITINGNDMTLSGCSSDTFKILEFTTSYRGLNDRVKINTISWLIEVE